jgi:hypothetical protein
MFLIAGSRGSQPNSLPFFRMRLWTTPDGLVSGTGMMYQSGHAHIAAAHRVPFRITQCCVWVGSFVVPFLCAHLPVLYIKTNETWYPCWCAAPARRALLLALNTNLGIVLPLLYHLASQHCGAAMAAQQAAAAGAAPCRRGHRRPGRS